jgi:hypothetical protein
MWRSEVILRVGHLKTCGVIRRFIDTMEVPLRIYRCSCRTSMVESEGRAMHEELRSHPTDWHS